MWPADIGANDGWRVGGCGRLSPPHFIFGSYLAIDGWMMTDITRVGARSDTVPRVRSGFGQYKPLVGRATGIRSQ